LTLPASGELSFSDIQTEFGGIPPVEIDEYYRGGLYVPSSETSIPTSGTIELDDFYGTSGATVITVTEGTYVGFLTSHGYAAAGKSVEIGNPLFGSRSPTSLSGSTIQGLYYWGSFEFYVAINGNLAQSFFTSCTPQGGSALTSASATHYYDPSPAQTIWSWSTALTGWDGAGTRTVAFT